MTKIKGIKLIGIGSYTPEKIVKNDDLSSIVETSDEWISTRTGIRERRISIDENTSQLASQAAVKAIANAGITPEDIDLIIVATITPDSFMPSTACLVQDKIGALNAVAFDVNAACTGFIYALNTASLFISSGQYKTALVIGAEVLSKVMDWTDRNTCVLFGDGAGAVVLTSGDKNNEIYTNLKSDGSKSKVLTCPAVPLKNVFIEEKDNTENTNTVKMNGKEVFKFAVKVIVSSVEDILKESGYSIEDIKYIVPHQANFRIIDAAAKKLEVEESKFFMNLNKYGNTSGASIPLALDEMYRASLIEKGDKLILVGFGGGLTWGSVLIEWN